MKLIYLTLFLLIIIGCTNEGQIDIMEGKMKLASIFGNNEMIPGKYTCQGSNINPPLIISDMPSNTKSLALIIDDPDAPVGTWDHWIVHNIEPKNSINENSIPGIQAKNSWGKNEYGGPCPPSGTHRYFFKLYALDIKLDLNEGASKKQLENAMKNHIIEKTELIGLYKKP